MDGFTSSKAGEATWVTGTARGLFNTERSFAQHPIELETQIGGGIPSYGDAAPVVADWEVKETPFEKRRGIDSQSSKYPGLKGYEVMALPDICTVWKVRPAKPIANMPVVSNIPTLVLTAQYDAYTPPAWGKNVAGRLGNSFYYEVPWAGHGPGFSVPCVGNLIASFFDEPTKAPSSECTDKTRSQFKFLIKKT